MMTRPTLTAVNVRDFGGVDAAVAAGVVYIGRPSPLGNPFVIGKDGARDEVVAKYRAWLWQRIWAGDLGVLDAIRAIPADAKVGCWCKPLACHADVVIAAVVWLRRLELVPVHTE
jgi:hypothetical protein